MHHIWQPISLRTRRCIWFDATETWTGDGWQGDAAPGPCDSLDARAEWRAA